jgi:hypothetical protein
MNEDDDIGLLCVPPGMRASQAEEFNKKFRSMTEQERQTVIGNMTVNLTQKGQPIVEAIQNSIRKDLEK